MQALSLQVAGSDPPQWYASLVLDFREGQELEIGVPTSQGSEVPVRAGSRVLLEVTLPDGLRRMNATVRSRKNTSPPSLLLDWPQAEERIQRRENVRVETMINAEVRPILPEGSLGPPVHGLVADISAGGARIFVASNLHIGTEIQITMQLPGIGERRCDARVVRGGLNSAQSTTHPVWIGVMFTDAAQPFRRELAKLVFDIQREQLKKGIR